jgi:hypothetical protein
MIDLCILRIMKKQGERIVMEYRRIVILSLFWIIATSPGCTGKSELGRLHEVPPQKIESPYVLEKKKLPGKVHRLFYAVKDSLDYASITGDINGPFEDVPDDPPPKKTLAEYERVTDSLLEDFNREFVVERYIAKDWDYELIVKKRENPNEKYKATRIQTFRFENGEWRSIGLYLHW